MHTLPRMRQVQLFMGATLLMCAQAASAQYVWVNEKGVKQFSDRAPPASVPLKNIIKAPGGRTALTSAPAAAEAEPVKAGPGAEKPAAPLTVAEREAAYRKQKTAQAEKETKLAAVAANQQQRQVACDAAAASRATLDSGVRLRGEDKVWLNDQQRAEHSAQVDRIINECNNPTEVQTAKK